MGTERENEQATSAWGGISRWAVLDALLLAVASAVLVFYKLGDKPLAGDEATSYFIATRSWHDFWISITTSEANASLFYALLRLPVAIGTDPLVLRSMSAVCAVVTVVALYLLLARWFGRWTGIAGAATLAVNAFFVTQAQDVRGYAMSAMFATLATLLFTLCVERPSPLRLALYVGAAVAGCYSHFFCAVVVAAHFISLFTLPKRTVAWARFIGAYAAMTALCIPLAYFVLTNDRGQVDWIPDPTAAIMLKNLKEFVGNADSLLALVAVATVVLALTRLVVTATRAGRSTETWSGTLLLAWLILPLAFMTAISVIKPLFVARYVLVSLPALAGVIAYGIGIARWRPAFIVGCAGVLALTAAKLPEWYSATRPDWQVHADVVVRNSGSNDATIVYAPTTIRPFGYYAGYYAERDDGLVAPEPIYPPIDWLGYSRTRFHPDLDAILDKAAEHEQVWLVRGFARDKPRERELKALVEALRESCSDSIGFTGAARLFVNCERS